MSIIRLSHLVFFITAVLLMVHTASAQTPPTVSAALSSTIFPVNRSVNLTITISGKNNGVPDIPTVEGLQFFRRGQSSQVRIVNGSYFSSVQITYAVQALAPGKYKIPPINIQFKNHTLPTNPLSVEVLPTGQTAATGAAVYSGTPKKTGQAQTRLRSGKTAKIAFMQINPASNKLYSGETIPLEVKVYIREGIKASHYTLPMLLGDGFVLRQLERKPAYTRESVNNITYSVLTWNTAISGVKEGVHPLSMEIDVTLLIREQQRRSSAMGRFNDPFLNDDFFAGFFGRYREKEAKIVSPELSLEVLPLPAANQPPGFTGAIGDFTLNVEASPTEIKTGDPITLTMTVRGKGNFTRVEAPALTGDEGWKLYTPSAELKGLDKNGLGKKIFEQAIILKDQNQDHIPAITFSYFNPIEKKYITLTHEPIPLLVRQQKHEPVGVIPNAPVSPKTEKRTEIDQNTISPIPGMAPLHLEPGKSQSAIIPVFTRTWFILAAILLAVIMAGTLILQLLNKRLADNPALQKKLSLNKQLQLSTKELIAAVSRNDSRDFLAASRLAIQNQLGIAWNRKAGAITLADLQQHLAPDSSVINLFSKAENNAYSGQTMSTEEMQQTSEQLIKELGEIA